MKKILGGILIFALLLALGGLGTFEYLMRRSVPQVEGSLVLKGLKQEVKVYRDKFGIPHIEAKNEEDLYRAYGYVHGSERLFQLELYRRASRGQLSEIFGELGLEKDKLSRTLNLDYPHKNPYRVPLSPEAKTRMEAYLQGLNSFIDQGQLPIEFSLLKYKPQHFEFKDVYSFIGYMAFLFGNAPKQDPLFYRLKNYYDQETISLMGNEAANLKREVMSSAPVNLDVLYDESLFYLPPVDGSNAWLIGPDRSSSGRAILANDPHVGISLPGLWFEAHLKSPQFEIYGHFLPLIPFAALGHNHKRAWGMTISYVDDMDFYKETVDWKTKKVSYKGEELSLKERKHVIKVKGKDDVQFSSWDGPHGPLLGKASEDSFSLPEFALKWTYHHEDNRPLEAFFSMSYAQSMDDMRLAVTLGTAPGLNIMYADSDNNIAWWMYGSIPRRPDGMEGGGVYPGENGEFDWLGFFSVDEKPQIENPATGIIVSANGRPPGAPKTVKGYWQPQDRAQTIYEELSRKSKWDSKGVRDLQGSNYNSKAKKFRELLSRYLKTEKFEEETQIAALDLLVTWDGHSNKDSGGALVFNATSLKLLRNLFDELNENDYLKYCAVNASWRALYRFTELPEHTIWDLKATGTNEDMRQVIRKSFVEATSELKEKYGSKVSQWRWGEHHQVEFRHALGSKGGVLGAIFNLGPYPVDGSYNSINNYRRLGCKHDFSVRAGPSTRVVVDFEDTKNTFGGLPLGVSGHHRSPYFSNERKDFLEAKHRPQIMDWKKISGYKSLTLSPSP